MNPNVKRGPENDLWTVADNVDDTSRLRRYKNQPMNGRAGARFSAPFPLKTGIEGGGV
jgi:hypothetical protein